MTSHGNRGCSLFLTDDKMNVAAQAQHYVKRLKKGGGSTVMVVDFMVATLHRGGSQSSYATTHNDNRCMNHHILSFSIFITL